MTARPIGIVCLLLLALAAPGMVGGVAAESVPTYFEDGWVGFLCLNATPPGSGPIHVFLQINFDKVSLGGISLARADTLFAYVSANLGLLSPVIGHDPQPFCSFSPSFIQAQFPNATALQAVQLLSPSFHQMGFDRYVIYDSFLTAALLYFGPVSTLRAEIYVVNGSNDISFVLSNEIPTSLLP